jgi:hypothetical protein
MKFKDHDYYLLVLIPLFAIVTINMFLLLKNLSVKIYNSKYTKTIFFILVVLSLNYGIKNFHRRYNKNFRYEDVAQKIKPAVNYFDKNKIAKDKKVYVFGDETYNGSLYFLKMKGLTFKNYNEYKAEKSKIKIRPDYIILLDTANILLTNAKLKYRKVFEKQGTIILEVSNY